MSRTDLQLLEATRAGDAEAFGDLYLRHCGVVKRYIRQRTGTHDEAADLVAETFAAALLSTHRGLAGGVTEARPWLLGIARNKLIDSYRASSVATAARSELNFQRPPLGAADDFDQSVGLSNAINQLPASERQALIERILLERGYDAIGRNHGISATVARKRVSRALVRLREAKGAKV